MCKQKKFQRERSYWTPEDQEAVEKAISVKVMGVMVEDDPRKSGGDYYVCWIAEAQVFLRGCEKNNATLMDAGAGRRRLT